MNPLETLLCIPPLSFLFCQPGCSSETTAEPEQPVSHGKPIEISAGGEHACALFEDGAVACWGSTFCTQTGTGQTEPALFPNFIQGLTGPVKHISAGHPMTCAHLQDDAIQCWGLVLNSGSVLQGVDSLPPQYALDILPHAVLGLEGPPMQVAARGASACALLETGKVQCWGSPIISSCGWSEDMGEIINSTLTAEGVNGLDEGITHLAAGFERACGILQNGAVQCWGSDDVEPGVYSFVPPPAVEWLDKKTVEVTVGWHHTCVLSSAGDVHCWGDNDYLQLAYVEPVDNTKPVSDGEPEVSANLIPLSGPAAQIAAGGWHTCATLADGDQKGTVECWGRNNADQLGSGQYSGPSLPRRVQGLGDKVTMVSAGVEHTCTLLVNGAIQCWGSNEDGQLGDGTTDNKWTPVVVQFEEE